VFRFGDCEGFRAGEMVDERAFVDLAEALLLVYPCFYR
jgi:hypothetical protein